MNKLKVLSLFSGIGAFEKALTNLNIDFELVSFSEIDKYAIKSYCAIHNVDESLNLGDVSKVETNSIPDFDLMTYGFPCQDISIAGKQRGFTEGAETRSSLLWEAMKIAKVKKPKYMIAENVKNLIGKKFKEDFDKYINYLDELGYNTYYQVLNAKEFGVPQNRERVFVVSIRKDIDNDNFEFPKGKDNGIRLKDILEISVVDKYYLSEEVQKRFKFNEKYHESIIGSTKPDFRTIGQRDVVYKQDGIMGSLVATDYKQPKQIIEMVGELDIKGHDVIKRVYSPSGISPTLTTMEGGNRQPKVLSVIPGAIRGRYDESNKIQQQLELKSDEIINTLTTVQKDNVIIETPPFKIRKLTPLECFRLMGFSDEDFNAARNVPTSDTQLYKQAGNSIVVNVLESLLHNLFIDIK
jgi:DNA (cytosine-5)-methyltransferase 1